LSLSAVLLRKITLAICSSVNGAPIVGGQVYRSAHITNYA